MVHLNWQPLCMMPDPQRFASKQARYYSLRLRPGAVLPDAHLENDVVALRLAANNSLEVLEAASLACRPGSFATGLYSNSPA